MLFELKGFEPFDSFVSQIYTITRTHTPFIVVSRQISGLGDLFANEGLHRDERSTRIYNKNPERSTGIDNKMREARGQTIIDVKMREARGNIQYQNIILLQNVS